MERNHLAARGNFLLGQYAISVGLLTGQGLYVAPQDDLPMNSAWPRFGGGRGYRVVSVRSCQQLPPCLTDPLLAKADPITYGGNASVIT